MCPCAACVSACLCVAESGWNLASGRYQAAFQDTEALTVDVDFTGPENWIFHLLRHVGDLHPDAHAARLRMILAVQHSENPLPDGWEAHMEFEGYLAKRAFVSAHCRLSAAEELELLLLCSQKPPHVHLRHCYFKTDTAEFPSGAAGVVAAVEEFRRKTRANTTVKRPRIGGAPWEQGVVHASDTLLADAKMPRSYYYENPGGSPDVRDGDLAEMIMENNLMDDRESGVSRKLGFLFLCVFIFQPTQSLVVVLPEPWTGCDCCCPSRVRRGGVRTTMTLGLTLCFRVVPRLLQVPITQRPGHCVHERG